MREREFSKLRDWYQALTHNMDIEITLAQDELSWAIK